ncbi:uncharacterized protein LOC144475183 isoform X2 [Augochlora pura]
MVVYFQNKMEISPRKPSKRAQEPVDEWLQAKGYFRKHAPRDPTCLFRAVSEQVYMTQHYHLRVRKECVEFMRTMTQSAFENIVIPFDDYIDQMACFTEWGGRNEIQAMSLLYKKEFVIFSGQKQIQRIITNNGFKDAIYLCHTPQKQYESICTQDFVATAAYCQSIVYQILYRGVFNMVNLESTVHKMLHDRTATFRHDKFFLKGNIEMRDQLTAEIYNKVENGIDELDDAQSAGKNIPPFPYRVAKALDPNIYRNTDFDIWHEIRRVKNAGWTRHNSHELQVGGKCLIQMDFNEEDFDKANNNNVYVSSLEKDANYNDTKVLQKIDKQDPVYLFGHIQEMSKDRGPVLVFIEELGEKKIVPYSALKPLPLRKSKQSNWPPMCKRNMLLDSNQKWKKPYSAVSRKIKQTVSSVTISSGTVDKNGNNENCSDGINKNSIQWKKECLKEEQPQAYENYGLEKYGNYSVNTSSEMFPTKTNLDNTQSLVADIGQENDKGHKEKNTFENINTDKYSVKNSKPDNALSSDNNTGFDSYPIQRTQMENFYSPYSGEQISATQVDNILRSINCSVQKSVDVNGSDLPLSDPFTLRFFYNLGLECFRGGSNWNYLTNEQSSGAGQWYQGMPQNEDEITTIANGVMQHCAVSPQRSDHSSDQKENNSQLLNQESGDNCATVKDATVQNSEVAKTDEGKDALQPPREKTKDQEPVNRDSFRPSRNVLAPRFKRNSDNRYRTSSHFTHQGNQYSHSGPNTKSSKSQELKNDSVQQSMTAPHQMHDSTVAAMNSYQAPYMQQGMYSGMPYYANEAEAFANPFYPPNPGFFPIPCLPHSDIPDNGNMQPFSPHLFPGMDYTQAYPNVCPPYMCPPQPAPYNMPPQNMQEHWYAVAGQPHYMPYAPMLPVTTDGVCNGLTQNVNQSTSTPDCITMQVCSNL